MLGIENLWGNQWKHVLDITILDYVPYVCDDLQKWTETSTPNTNEAFSAVNYSVTTENGYARLSLFYETWLYLTIPVPLGRNIVKAKVC